MTTMLVPLFISAFVLCTHSMPPEWNLPSVPDSWGINSASAHRCVNIPPTVELCANVPYKQMRLPNMLNHDNVKEVEEQTAHWKPLVRTACHKEIRIFLCSIYAPVCMLHLPDKQIRPCRSLCQAVMNSCLHIMQRYGYSWPEMLNCEQFPTDDDLMCIRSSTNLNLLNDTEAECQACAENSTFESIISHHCLHHVVFRARIKDVKDDTYASKKIVSFRKRIRFFKSGSLSKAQEKSIRNAELDVSGCKCNSINNRDKRAKFLFMGDVTSSGKILLKYFVKWDKRNKVFMKTVRKIRRNQKKNDANLCRVEQAFISKSSSRNSKGSKRKREGKRKRDRKKKGKKRKNKNRKNRRRKNKNRKAKKTRDIGTSAKASQSSKENPRYSYNNFYYSHYKS